MILVNLKPVYLSSFIERRDQYIALESRPAGQSFEIDPYINTADTHEGVMSRSLEYPERLVSLIKKVEVSRDNILVNDWNFIAEHFVLQPIPCRSIQHFTRTEDSFNIIVVDSA